MKVTCNRERLREALAVVNNVIPQKHARPTLENVLLVATDHALELVGSDMEVSIRYRIHAAPLAGLEVVETGTALIQARVANDFVRDLSSESVTIEATGDRCSISGEEDHCELPVVDPEEYPPIAMFDSQGAITLQGGLFSKLVQRTAFAAAREQGRYAMHGILVELQDGTLKLVATDGRRLAITHSEIDSKNLPPRRAIVPTKGLLLMSRVIREPLSNVALQFSENQLALKASAVALPAKKGESGQEPEPVVLEEIECFARLIEGEFPKYATVIPSSADNILEADTELLTRKLRLVANVTSNDTRAVKLSFAKGELEIKARSPARGEASAHMKVDYKGKPMEIAFNPDFVMDGLKNCEKTPVTLEFRERTSPGKFELAENYYYVVMPITVDT